MNKTYFKCKLGVETRGKTAPNRLRRVDIFVMFYCRELLEKSNTMFVDVGFGSKNTTTIESIHRFRRINETLQVLGVEIDSKRVRDAQKDDNDLTHFRHGGFNLPIQNNETVYLIRAFNVLRQYETEDECANYCKIMGNYLEQNGILIEGTSDQFGRYWVANIIRKINQNEIRLEAVVFSTNFKQGFDIVEFQKVLPKNFIHRMTNTNEMIFRFFNDWKFAHEITAKPMKIMLSPKQQFIMTARQLAEKYNYKIDTRKKILKSGFLIWKLN
ncbi:unnamed protein product [Didymodactylos carnosus]|uniref:Uncharacterized protein n=1 Tax=Didymodactylos carnosus TaxID=1234261 RepID=A0A815AXS4_9BILA|nr:unnamed protein product [Didymodactylos carnosus]CAF1273520.1 unnamed protein product [Didymodactylos carnosus]CAF4048857.1 unnamed protein product [Didymodactylos carnosus]CAF4078808.1 unnamed protein product [Didymodactylos carnosus]